MGNIDDIYRYIKERSKEIKEQNKDLLAYVWVPSYLTCSSTIVGNPAPNIKVKSKYALTEVNSSYYTTFNINKDLKNE